MPLCEVVGTGLFHPNWVPYLFYVKLAGFEGCKMKSLSLLAWKCNLHKKGFSHDIKAPSIIAT